MHAASKHLRKNPLTLCLAAALALGEPLLAAAPAAASAHAAAVRAADVIPLPPHLRATAVPRRAPRPSGVPIAVTNCNDSGPGSLRDAVAAAVDQDGIDLSALTCSTITLTSGAIDVTVPHLYIFASRLAAVNAAASLRQPSVTIDGGGVDRVFTHHPSSGGRLSLEGLVLTNGKAEGDGGCIVSDGEVDLYNAYVSNCHAHTTTDQAHGGAIASTQDVRVSRSTIVDSSAYSDANYAKGGAVYAAGTLDLVAATISGNSARSGTTRSFGGGAFVKGFSYVSQSTIDGNDAYNVGGIAFVGGAGYSADVYSSTISNNSATGFMGGLYSSVHLTVRNSTIAFNCAGSTVVAPGYVTGIGLQNYYTSPYLQSTIIADNDFCPAARPGALLDSAYDISVYGANPILGDHNLIVSSTVALPAGTLRSDPQLGPLADNGGPTRTHALGPTSPAINAGAAGDDVFDQRGRWFTRIIGPLADIGAYEVQSDGPTRLVTTCADTGDGSLRDVITRAESGDSVDLSRLACSTITLSRQLEIPQGNLHLIGPGSRLLTIDAAGAGRVLYHNGAGTLRMEGLSLVNGVARDAEYGVGGCLSSYGRVIASDIVLSGCTAERTTTYSSFGGAAYAYDLELTDSIVTHNSATAEDGQSIGGGVAATVLVLDRTTLSGNTASATSGESYGGGFFSWYTQTVTNSTISGNRADSGGGAFFENLAITNSTLSGNTASKKGAGAYGYVLEMFNSTVTDNHTDEGATPGAGGILATQSASIASSILFGNTQGTTPFDFDGATLEGSHDLIGESTVIVPPDTISDDPHLGPLQDNGGPTFTHALLAGSPAIDAGSNPTGAATDQRGDGFPRVNGAVADIGAFEATPDTGGDDRIFVDGFDPAALR